MIKETFEVSEAVPRRTAYQVLAALMEEVGELSTEVMIADGYSNKEEGIDDGITEEAVDVIICALDLIWATSANITNKELEQHVNEIVKRKLEKWRKKHDS